MAIGDRPAGSSVSVDVSRSPNTVIATVRGIGVAVITSRCGGAADLLRSASRCSTPNRCCSSTTTRPSSANWTCSWISACVPMTIPALPLAASSSAALRAAAGSDPVSSTTRVAMSAPPSWPACASGPSIASMVRACCAGQHLGRREQRRLGAGVDGLQHRPQRDHGLARADLALQQPVHRVLAGQLGLELLADLDLPGGELERQPRVERVEQPAGLAAAAAIAGLTAAACRRWASASCTANASSHFSRCLAAHHACRSSGWCTPRIAASKSSRPRRARISAGTGSGIGVEHLEHLVDRLGDHPGAQVLGRGVDRR